MDIKKYQQLPNEETEKAIELRRVQAEALEPFRGWHFSKTEELRKIQRNQERLKALLEDRKND